jgi:hypothetical protein
MARRFQHQIRFKVERVIHLFNCFILRMIFCMKVEKGKVLVSIQKVTVLYSDDLQSLKFIIN